MRFSELAALPAVPNRSTLPRRWVWLADGEWNQSGSTSLPRPV